VPGINGAPIPVAVQITIFTLVATTVAKTLRLTSWTMDPRLGIRPNNRAHNHLSVCRTPPEQHLIDVTFRDLLLDIAIP
jgi:hypothetical protein